MMACVATDGWTAEYLSQQCGKEVRLHCFVYRTTLIANAISSSAVYICRRSKSNFPALNRANPGNSSLSALACSCGPSDGVR